jgi:hypothetical protein
MAGASSPDARKSARSDTTERLVLAGLTYALGAIGTWALTNAWARPGHFNLLPAGLAIVLLPALEATAGAVARTRPAARCRIHIAMLIIAAVGGVASVAGWRWRLMPSLVAAALAIAPRIAGACSADRPLAFVVAGPFAAYGVVVLAAIAGWAPIWALGVAFTVPLALRLRRARHGALPAPLTTELAVAFTALLTAGYLIQGMIR